MSIWTLLTLLPTFCCYHLEDPIVIERPMNKVEWSDLMLEYDAAQLPPNNDTIVISLNILYARKSEDVLTLLAEMSESWRDSRLRYQGSDERATIPSHLKVWTPDTFIAEALSESVLHSVLFLLPNGRVVHRKRSRIEIVRPSEAANYTLTFASFTSPQPLVYKLSSLQVPANSTLIAGYSVDSAISTLEDGDTRIGLRVVLSN